MSNERDKGFLSHLISEAGSIVVLALIVPWFCALPISPFVWLLMVAVGLAPMSWPGLFWNWVITAVMLSVWFVDLTIRARWRFYERFVKRDAAIRAWMTAQATIFVTVHPPPDLKGWSSLNKWSLSAWEACRGPLAAAFPDEAAEGIIDWQNEYETILMMVAAETREQAELQQATLDFVSELTGQQFPRATEPLPPDQQAYTYAYLCAIAEGRTPEEAAQAGETALEALEASKQPRPQQIPPEMLPGRPGSEA